MPSKKSSSKNPKKSNLMLSFLKFIVKYCIILAAWLSVAVFIAIGYYYQDLPSLKELDDKNNQKVVDILYSNDEKITTIGNSAKDEVTYDQIPKHLIEAVVATEDRRFFKHHGFDILGIARASYANFKAGKIVQGGSSITQQLVKLLYFDSDRTFKRKVQELFLAVKIEKIFSKEQILTLYLNRAYFGAGNYGITKASKYYFNKKVADLNVNQAALLAGLLKAPSKLAPTHNRKLAEERANEVLGNMVEAGYLPEQDFGNFGKKIKYQTDNLQRLYFADYIVENFDYYLPEDQRQNSSFVIETTLDYHIQSVTQTAVEKYFSKNQKKLKNSQIAVIVMGKDGAIKAMIGGKNYQKSQYNRAIYSKRQAGSVFKTFIYLEAFIEGYDTDDEIEDKAVNIGGWEPENYAKTYQGDVELKEAFAKSLNSVAVQLYQKIDREELVKLCRKMGLFAKINGDDATSALGTMQVSLLEMVNAFAVINNNGEGVLPYQITKISDDHGVIYQRQSSGIGLIIEEDALEKIKEVLREAVENGTGKKADIASNIYGKTGTTQDFKDAWFVGFNDDYTVGVWMGNDDNSPTNKISGGSAPAEIFAQIMSGIK